MRILIAEDDAASRHILRSLLTKWGHHVIVACNGKEALALIRQDPPPEIAVLDWMMPEIDGIEVCRQVRQMGTPVYLIMLTAKSLKEDLIAGLAAGADDYVTKPFVPQELHARILGGIRVTDLQRKLAQRVRELEVAMAISSQVQQEQKLEALGRLASGVAHEINTPVQFVSDSVYFVKDVMVELGGLISKYQALRESVLLGQPSMEIAHEVARTEEEVDLKYVLDEVPKALDRSIDGLSRVATIVRSMKDFAHPDKQEMCIVDLNRSIQSTLTIARNEYKYVADVKTDFAELPPVACHVGLINQVILNILINATHAITDAMSQTDRKGIIGVRTVLDGDHVIIAISDTGTGIPETAREHIFDPFFTTKEVGEGTGQGLAIARSVMEKHKGTITFETETGKGTTFFLRLPAECSVAVAETV